MTVVDWKRDRRQYLRFGVDLPVELILSQTQSMRVKALDISAAGMYFLCDRWDVQLVIPPNHSLTPANPIKVTIRFQAPDIEGVDRRKMSISAEIISCVRLAENQYRVNVRFSGFWGGSKQQLQGFLDSLSKTTD